MGNKPVMAIVLIVVIVACIAFMIHSGTKKSGSGGASAGGPQGHDLICMACNKPFKLTMKDEEWMPMQMQGKNATKKVKCPACGKDEGVAAQKCASCGEIVPAAGMMGMMGPGAGAKASVCPKCKKPLVTTSQPGPQGATPPAAPAAK